MMKKGDAEERALRARVFECLKILVSLPDFTEEDRKTFMEKVKHIFGQ